MREAGQVREFRGGQKRRGRVSGLPVYMGYSCRVSLRPEGRVGERAGQ